MRTRLYLVGWARHVLTCPVCRALLAHPVDLVKDLVDWIQTVRSAH